MIILDYKDRRPLYEQVVDRISDLILKGVLQPDERIPSVRNLAMELAINPNTIQKAYSELERKEFIYSIKGRGSFVSNNDNLISQKQEQIRHGLKRELEEARMHGVSKAEIETILNMVYEGGEEHA